MELKTFPRGIQDLFRYFCKEKLCCQSRAVLKRPSSTVFCSVTARTGINALVVMSKKSQKGRTQMCFECKCRINNILGKKQWPSLPYSQCSLVIAHRCAEYESLRFDCSLELRIFFSDLCPWHDAKTSLLMTMSYSTLKFWSVLGIGWLSEQGHNTNISSVWVSIPSEKVTKQRGLPWRVTRDALIVK